MVSILLAVIYMAFISLGLPDSILGAAWPTMRMDLNVPVSYAGIISMIIAGGTIVSSLLSDKLTRKLGAGLVTAISVAATAVALLGFSLSKSFVMLCVCAIPYGLGAGAVDAALNNYVALHYSSKHMSWLHAFWGVGVSISPYIMSYSLAHQHGWSGGYFGVFAIQVVLVLIFFLSLPLWDKSNVQDGEKPNEITLSNAVRIKGAAFCLVAFLCFCGFESTAGLWASSYMVGVRGVGAETAAGFASLFYLGITFGRFLSGFIADRVGDKNMIRYGIAGMLFGIALIILPVETDKLALIGLVTIGFGSAPVYPCIIHSTPANFGKKNSQSLVGIQMASAYVGSTFMPPLFGLIAEHVTIELYPYYLAVLIGSMLIMSEIMNKKVSSVSRI